QYPVFKVPGRPIRGLRSRFPEVSAQENILPLSGSQCKKYFEKIQKFILLQTEKRNRLTRNPLSAPR
ncbi:MAG: hypothetical protein RR671_00315, partial [Raoultibacter sp.]